MRMWCIYVGLVESLEFRTQTEAGKIKPHIITAAIVSRLMPAKVWTYVDLSDLGVLRSHDERVVFFLGGDRKSVV